MIEHNWGAIYICIWHLPSSTAPTFHPPPLTISFSFLLSFLSLSIILDQPVFLLKKQQIIYSSYDNTETVIGTLDGISLSRNYLSMLKYQPSRVKDNSERHLMRTYDIDRYCGRHLIHYLTRLFMCNTMKKVGK